MRRRPAVPPRRRCESRRQVRASGGVMAVHRYTFVVGLVVCVSACVQVATQPDAVTIGPNPVLPAPDKGLLPTIKVAPAKGWPVGAKPVLAAGTLFNALST